MPHRPVHLSSPSFSTGPTPPPHDKHCSQRLSPPVPSCVPLCLILCLALCRLLPACLPSLPAPLACLLPQPLPDALRGEQWAFVQLPLGNLREMLQPVEEVSGEGEQMCSPGSATYAQQLQGAASALHAGALANSRQQQLQISHPVSRAVLVAQQRVGLPPAVAASSI